MPIQIVLLDLLVQAPILHQGNTASIHLLLIVGLHQVLRLDVLTADLVLLAVSALR